MSEPHLSELFAPVFSDIVERATVADTFVDRNVYQILMATLWANVVMSPEDAGLEDADLERVHDELNTEIARQLGPEQNLRTAFAFITSKSGETAMNEARLSSAHRDLLTYFASMILDPERHKVMVQEIREKQQT